MTEPLRFAALLELRAEGGTVKQSGTEWTVEQADALTIYVASATSYVNFLDVNADPVARCEETLRALQDQTYDQVREHHRADYQALFRRMDLNLGPGQLDLPTDQRIEQFRDGQDPQLAALFFQFGRYLMISSSRPGTQPANLQGLWNESLSPPWESKYTVNINTQMNYWPAEPCNLAECHLPLFDAMQEIAVRGSRVAQRTLQRAWLGVASQF